MPVLSEEQGIRTYSAEAIKEICLDAGADDVGLLDLDRESCKSRKRGSYTFVPLLAVSMNSCQNKLYTGGKENGRKCVS